MKYEDAKKCCAVRSGIVRAGNPTKAFAEKEFLEMPLQQQKLYLGRDGGSVPNVYWKNNPVSLDERVPESEKLHDDWEEYDPRERRECSSYNEMPA